jgi:FMN phosphatase YigB (HAD superfamily)
VPLRAAFFDVGDTLVEGWVPADQMNSLMREAYLRRFGEREWYEAFVSAQFAAPSDAEPLRQETNRWVEEWFVNSGFGLDDIEVDHLRSASALPLDVVSHLVAGAAEALRWCKSKGLAVVLVTNTLWRGDEEARNDWQRLGLADAIDHVVTSHTAGWQKPHEQIFRRALELAGASAGQAVMVGDRLRQDVWGAKRLGMRAILRRTTVGAPQEQVDVLPDATIDDLTELPPLLERWG